MTPPADVRELIAVQLNSPDTQWSIGTFGGIAEFARDRGEAVLIDTAKPEMTAVTARGGIRLSSVDALRPFASESISKLGWNHRVALCLPERDCAMNQRTALTEVGLDHASLRADDRDAILFDLGLDVPQADLCVRIADPAVAAELRRHVGRPVFDPDNPAMRIVLAANPHRVFVTRAGRAEVYQPIPPADGTSPDGPHTHVLPKLLRHRRTHPATEPVPEGWVPCAHFYPQHPMKDGFGRAKLFDPDAHRAFQVLLARYGDPESQALKSRVTSLIAAEQPPGADVVANGRLARTNIRLAIRQLQAADRLSPTLKLWLAAFDQVDDEPDDDTLVH